MEIIIFDVEHGACALVTADNGRRLMIDCGHNASTGWRPSKALPANGIETLDCLAVSNYDEDHVSDLPNLLQTIYVPVLFRNPSVWPALLETMKADCGIGKGISTLAFMAANHYTAPVALPLDFGALQLGYYWNAYPEFKDENNLSLVTILRYYNLGIIFPGDLEKGGWERLLQRPDFRSALACVNIFVASHHGRESGYCSEVFKYCRPEVVICSDSAVVHDTQKATSKYRVCATGVRFTDGITRYVLSTRNNGAIVLRQTGPEPGYVWISKA